MASMLVALLCILAAAPSDAFAQSSVRPPANATTNVAPGQQAPQPFTEDQLPGNRMGDNPGAEMWRSVRQGIRGSVSIPDKKAGQLVQSEGDIWRAVRNGPLVRWGAYWLAGVVVLLALFFLIRGRIRVEHGFSGRTITRFGFVERATHWLLAVSFILLGLTGLNITYGKRVLLPIMDKEVFATIALWGKYIHNYVAFAFMLGLVMILILWIAENIPNRYDLTWLVKGGGMFTKGTHPPARKFNAGQKILYWLVLFAGLSLVLSGIDLLFPFEMAMFSKTFVLLNKLGADLPTALTPVEEMQLATIWHAVVAIFMVGVILAHIYIGTLGMEGAFAAMNSGEVDENWAKEHHSVWAAEVAEESKRPSAGAKPSPAAAE